MDHSSDDNKLSVWYTVTTVVRVMRNEKMSEWMCLLEAQNDCEIATVPFKWWWVPRYIFFFFPLCILDCLYVLRFVESIMWIHWIYQFDCGRKKESETENVCVCEGKREMEPLNFEFVIPDSKLSTVHAQSSGWHSLDFITQSVLKLQL